MSESPDVHPDMVGDAAGDRQMSGKLEEQPNRTAPEGVSPPHPGPNHSKNLGKEGLGMTVSTPTTIGPDRTDLALSFLRLIGEQHESTRRHRIYYARMCRDNGMSYRQIADAYGVTEDAVRKMLKRNGGE